MNVTTLINVTNLDNIKKQRHHFADKGPLSEAIVFPIVMYGCDIWTLKKAKH